MADVEDEGDFESHFLDSMLEVEMTEEDGEVDVSKHDSPPSGVQSRLLPPIPMFDLQHETLSPDVFRNSVLSALSMGPVNNSPMAVPGINPALYHAEMMVSKQNLHKGSSSKMGNSHNSSGTKFHSKYTPKPVKNVVQSADLAGDIVAANFLKEVFKPDYIKNVFTKKDNPLSDLAVVTNEEIEYYNATFKDLTKVQYCRLHCTICDRHIGCGERATKKARMHKMLKTLVCKPCFEFYGDGNFPCDEGDNCEIYCRWCAQGGALVCCTFCPKVFCKKCVRQNFGPGFLKNIQRVTEWACFCCAQKPLWPHRAICRALLALVEKRKTDNKSPHKDTTKCCFHLKLQAQDKSFNSAQLNPADKLTSTPTTSNKDQFRGSLSNSSNKMLKIKNPPGRPLGSFKNSGTNANKRMSIPAAQFIQGPVLHGETVITPPASMMMQQKGLNSNPSTNPLSIAKVFLSTQIPTMDMRTLPSVKIPHDVQGLLLKLIFSDNREQLVRLLPDGRGCRNKNFPMPEFKNTSDFIDENLVNCFKFAKLLYDNLMKVKDKLDSRTQFAEENIFESSVNKLHFVYEKSIELLKELDRTLLNGYDAWKNETKGPGDMVSLSGEDEGAFDGETEISGEDNLDMANASSDPNRRRHSKFLEKYEELIPSEESDVEIVDDMDRKFYENLAALFGANFRGVPGLRRGVGRPRGIRGIIRGLQRGVRGRPRGPGRPRLTDPSEFREYRPRGRGGRRGRKRRIAEGDRQSIENGGTSGLDANIKRKRGRPRLRPSNAGQPYNGLETDSDAFKNGSNDELLDGVINGMKPSGLEMGEEEVDETGDEILDEQMEDEAFDDTVGFDQDEEEIMDDPTKYEDCEIKAEEKSYEDEIIEEMNEEEDNGNSENIEGETTKDSVEDLENEKTTNGTK